MISTQADCGAVAKHCPNLIRLDLSHCRQTGDQAAVNIAEKCHRLEYINMARSELLHKTSDVALLSIAEGCGKTLVELDLNGCEMVTDVGVSWVAHQAGATLEVFNLRGCNRLTNAGCRAAKESEIPNFKGSYLGRFPLVLADFWTSDHLSERSRSVDVFSVTRARGTLTCLLYTSPSPRDRTRSRMPSSA